MICDNCRIEMEMYDNVCSNCGSEVEYTPRTRRQEMPSSPTETPVKEKTLTSTGTNKNKARARVRFPWFFNAIDAKNLTHESRDPPVYESGEARI